MTPYLIDTESGTSTLHLAVSAYGAEIHSEYYTYHRKPAATSSQSKKPLDLLLSNLGRWPLSLEARTTPKHGGLTPLMFARHPSVIPELWRAGSDFSVTDDAGRGLLEHFSTGAFANADIVSVLIQEPCVP